MTGPGQPRDTVLAWGEGARGRLGLGNDTSPQLRPVRVPTLSGITAVAAGGSHSLALRPDGNVLAFGDNRKGQLGVGTNPDGTPLPDQLTPRDVVDEVIGPVGGRAIAAGLNHSVALLSDATALAWGDNSSRQLGTGVNPAFSPRPLKVGGSLKDVTAIAAGANHALAPLVSGSLAAWGANTRAQCGATPNRNLVTDNTDVISNVGRLNGVVVAAAGGSVHSVVLLRDGTLAAFGDNNLGQLGDGTRTERLARAQVQNDDIVQQVPLVAGVVRVAAGAFHNLALLSNGRLLAWGANDSGQLGDGTTVDRLLPVLVRDLGDGEIVDIAAGMDYSLALLADGTVLSWGGNAHGQLGDGTTNRRLTPVQVRDPDVPAKVLTGVKVVAVGSSHVLALR